jgi:hypothetical protein
MHLLKKGVPLCWDEVAQHSFKALKHALTSSPLLSPLDYGKDFLLYLAMQQSLLLVWSWFKRMTCSKEHVIYYLSRGLVRPKLNYTHVEKLALEAVHVVQRFCHYILLRKTTIIVS